MHKNFRSHDWFVCRKNNHEIKILNCIFRQFQSHDQSVDLLIIIIEQIWSNEQIEFQPHDQKFDFLKKLNFDLMKFDLMISSQLYTII